MKLPNKWWLDADHGSKRPPLAAAAAAQKEEKREGMARIDDKE